MVGRLIAARPDRLLVGAVCLALGLGWGCGKTGPVSLAWDYGFPANVDAMRAAAITAIVHEGGCSGAVHWQQSFSATAAASGMSPPVLAAGTWGFEVQALDTSCVTFAMGCTEVSLPYHDPQIVVHLMPVAESPACPSARCSAGECTPFDAGNCVPVPETCDGKDDNCDGVVDNVANLDSDPAHCGSCDVSCALTNATGECVGGTCTGQIGTCAAGFADCDTDPTDGCERSLTTLTDCGACDTPCSIANGTATCATGTCALQSCNPGFADCDSSAVTGCETAIDTLDHCGSCTNVCLPNHATESCVDGTCTVNSCDPGYDDCDTDPANGCETDVNTDRSNCGTCGTRCMGGTHLCCSGICGSC